MSVDHCFSIKGQGTVMTGTILSGSISLGDSVEIPALKVSLTLPFLLPSFSSGKGEEWSLCPQLGLLPETGQRALPCSISFHALPGFWNYHSPISYNSTHLLRSMMCRDEPPKVLPLLLSFISVIDNETEAPEGALGSGPCRQQVRC